MKLAITMGDPAGIGPETIVKAWPAFAADGMVYGDPAVIQDAIDRFHPSLRLRLISRPGQAQLEAGVVNCIATSQMPTLPVLGQVSPQAGASAFAAIKAAILAANQGWVDGIVTAPINKAALSAAHIDYPGHTEMLQDLGGAAEVGMVLANDDLAVILATVHCSMRQAIEQIEQGAVGRCLELAQRALTDMGKPHGRIAVAGLNPHAGESGLFGDEEQRFITPAIQHARSLGINASGPYPGDTVFMRARRGEFDLVVAMYHDQGSFLSNIWASRQVST